MPTPTKGPRLGGSSAHQRHILSNLEGGREYRGRGGSVQRLALREARRAAGLIVADANRRLCVGRRSFADN